MLMGRYCYEAGRTVARKYKEFQIKRRLRLQRRFEHPPSKLIRTV
jgi:hypothetical protein